MLFGFLLNGGLLLWLGLRQSAVAMLLFAGVSFLLAYFVYGKHIAAKLHLGEQDPTPAHTQADGVDYVAAPMPVVLGHHFASIAGAAPIIGPVTAAKFGWVPVLIWIVLGGIFMGAVHDFTSMVASLRHKGRSIGEMIEEYLGHAGKMFFLIFAWATLILVIAVFTIVVAKTFTNTPAAASASLLLLLLAVGFGFTVYRWKINFAMASVVSVVLVFGSLVLGLYLPLDLRQWGVVQQLAQSVGWTPADMVMAIWTIFLMVYIFVASVAPVHILLQPRDYLNSFLLYGMIILGLLGVLIVQPAIQSPAQTSFSVEGLGMLFPMLFVTVACGAISGFHSLVSSGTSSKQLDREKDALPVAYGGMLIECMLAVLSLITAVMLTQADYAAQLKTMGPIKLFSVSLGTLMAGVGIPKHAAISFTALTVSAFALTSLDTATRLARFLFQELFSPRHDPSHQAEAPESSAPPAPSSWTNVLANRYVSTTLTVILGGALAFSGQWRILWPLFGAANQLLASLALLTVTVWLAHKKINNLFTLIPTAFMYLVTQSALGMIVYNNLRQGKYVLGVIAALLMVLSLFLGYLFLKDRRATHNVPATSNP
ncbi:MAG: carbon starvation protein A [Myxococcales bacterium]|nr:carbon starvation protein A [Myxococcales bacterium]MCB9644821.1 carbon starvation protein A [Myxococcales bacterium]